MQFRKVETKTLDLDEHLHKTQQHGKLRPAFTAQASWRQRHGRDWCDTCFVWIETKHKFMFFIRVLCFGMFFFGIARFEWIVNCWHTTYFWRSDYLIAVSEWVQGWMWPLVFYLCINWVRCSALMRGSCVIFRSVWLQVLPRAFAFLLFSSFLLSSVLDRTLTCCEKC